MEAVECGAASLGIILGYWKRFVPLEELRVACGVSRDGSNALNLIKAAEKYGLVGKGKKKEIEELYEIEHPAVIFWNFNHFLVLEGFGKKKIYLNDPAFGPRTVTYKEFAQGYTGIVLSFTPGSEFEKGGQTFSLTKELVRRLRSVKMPLFYLFLTGLCLIVPGLALPAFTRVFIDEVLVSNVLGWNWNFILGLLLTTTIGGCLYFLQQYVFKFLHGRLSIQFSKDFLWHLLKLPVEFYTQRFSGEIAYRVALNNEITHMMTGSLAMTCLDLVVVIFYGFIMLRYDLLIGGIGFAAAIANILIFWGIQRGRKDSYARLQQEKGKWMGNAIGALQQMDTIRSAGIESDFFARFAGYYTKNLNARQEISKNDAILGTVPIFLQGLAIAGLLVLGALKVMDGQLTIGMLMALQVLMISFLHPITNFVNFGLVMQNLKIDLARLADVLNNRTDPIYDESPPLSASPTSKLQGYLEFRDITFGYSPLAPPLIESLSFSIKPGQRVALVGPSGCGKSTVAKLACGLYRPWKGDIFFDGKPHRETSSKILVHSLASVDQSIFLFSGTVRENLTLWNSSVTDEMLMHAAKDACIHNEIIERDQGYEAELIEGGKNFSGGQRQRLEIARALLYSPSILVMDEATSSLDSETEKQISDHMRRRGCSAIMIAHRLSTIQDCDEIIVLNKGKVVERGTHTELKEKKGFYFDLVEAERS